MINTHKYIWFFASLLPLFVWAGSRQDSGTVHIGLIIPPQINARISEVSNHSDRVSYSLCVAGKGVGNYRLSAAREDLGVVRGDSNNEFVSYTIEQSELNNLVTKRYSPLHKVDASLLAGCEQELGPQVLVNARSAETGSAQPVSLIISAE